MPIDSIDLKSLSFTTLCQPTCPISYLPILILNCMFQPCWTTHNSFHTPRSYTSMAFPHLLYYPIPPIPHSVPYILLKIVYLTIFYSSLNYQTNDIDMSLTKPPQPSWQASFRCSSFCFPFHFVYASVFNWLFSSFSLH